MLRSNIEHDNIRSFLVKVDKAPSSVGLWLPSASVQKYVQTLLFENECDLPENEHVDGPHFHVNVIVRRLVLTQRHNSEMSC